MREISFYLMDWILLKKKNTFKLHDLLREMCLKIAQEEEFLYVLYNPPAINRERRIVISGEVGEVNHETKTFDAPIRCLICEGRLVSYDFKLLRTLNTLGTASRYDESILQQLNLRFLKIDYKCSICVFLPSSISQLWNLQILVIVTPHPSVVYAPYEIWEMIQLRHIEIDSICHEYPLPVDRLDQPNHVVLRNLRTLAVVQNLKLIEEVCQRIPNIITLHLSYFSEESSDYYPQNLGYFHQLEFLTLNFGGNSKWRDFALSLTFPSSLKWLHLLRCGVDWEELSTMVGSLPHLESLLLYFDAVIGSVLNPLRGNSFA